MKRGAPSGNIHAAVWLIGLGVLFITDSFWPGILILIGISMMLETVTKASTGEQGPTATATDIPEKPPVQAETKKQDVDKVELEEDPYPIPSFLEGEDSLVKGSAPSGNTDTLPATCPMCGGPVETHKVRWQDAQNPLCPYCDANLFIDKQDASG